jgi:hypothetical protein
MSTILYMEGGGEMSFQEKGTWVVLLVSIATYTVYLGIVLSRAGNTPLAEVEYVAAMLWTIGFAIVLNIVGHIVIAAASPKDADKSDERDTNINRFGEYVGATVLGVAILVPLGLTLAEFDHFWIANAIYAAFILQGLVVATVKLVAYRRGF